MQEIKLTDSPSQLFNVRLGDTRVEMHLKFNTHTERWTFDLKINGEDVLHGRKIITDTDLLAPFTSINIGVLFATDTSGQHNPPDRTNLPSGVVRFFQLTEEELSGVLV